MAAKSWITYSEECEFPIENLPYGVFHKAGEQASQARCATALGSFVVDLAALEASGAFSSTGLTANTFSQVCSSSLCSS
jgi:fumarylacetoacetase